MNVHVCRVEDQMNDSNQRKERNDKRPQRCTAVVSDTKDSGHSPQGTVRMRHGHCIIESTNSGGELSGESDHVGDISIPEAAIHTSRCY